MELANQTKAAINNALELDGGASFRRYLGEAIKEINDAFEPEQEKHPRKHLGASLIGRECNRYLWLSWRWAFWNKPMARMVRLFNRGHLEEARWIALIRQAGFVTQHLTEYGKQIRISDVGGHYGGSLDGVIYGCCEIPGQWGLLEFKTHNKKNFTKLVKCGVKETKNEHYVQCQQYMAKYNLQFALYCAICKDDDEIHLEIIRPDSVSVSLNLNKAKSIILADKIPNKCSASPLYETCKWCDAFQVCHAGAPVMKTCRSCEHVILADEGKWFCGHSRTELSGEQQFAACDKYILSRMF